MRIITHLDSQHMVNQYVVTAENSQEGILIDTPSLDKKLIETLEEKKIILKHILITHSHEGHVCSLGTFFKIYSPCVYSFLPKIGGYEAKEIKDGDELDIAGLHVEAIHVPGHSLDSICYKIGNALFTGDTLLSGSVGQTNTLVEKELLIKGIKEKLMAFDDNTLVFPGHGPLSKIRIEKMFNQDILEASITIFS